MGIKIDMTIRHMILTLSLLGAVWLGADRIQAAEPPRPNFVIFMTDDQRFDALSCAGNTILQTPNIDRLAAEGLRFTNMFVTNSLCAPSRATLLTGQYSHTHGVRDNKKKRIPATTPILPEILREQGYEVAFCGKSHVRGALRDRKWDYYFGFQGQGNYLKPVIAEGVDGEDLPREGYMDDVVTGKAVQWLKRRDSDKPFCLFVWFKAPHRSWLRARRHHDLFKDVAIPKPSTYDADLKGMPGKPDAFRNADNRIGDFNDVRSLDGFVKDYYATLVAVDENVGRVYDALKELKELDDTAILYTSDNGFFHGEWRAFDKRLMHEPSIRVPLLIRYPKQIAAGRVDDRMVTNVDIAPTVLDLASVKTPESMHGRSTVPLFAGDKETPWRDAWLYEYYEFPGAHSVRKHRGVRTDRWKYIHYFAEPQEYELYDLQADPDEVHNLYGQPEHEQTVQMLRKRLLELRRETGDPDLQ
ncbi:Arylsulfatase [Symmachiella dynata]|uniref:Arylsulfatase n=2 Tax=Symmachiella dynata TaxID=2527995 RepID=A0A517ZR46_9PLAN|nr:Arylsulfatase [Symmachiella dynata]